MKPITRSELFMAAAAGEYSGELPEPVTRPEFYWQKIAQRIDAGGSVSPEAIDAVLENFMNTLYAELSAELSGKANASHTHAQSEVTGLEAALSGKANASHTHAKSQITDLADASASSGGVGGAAGLMSAADKEKLDAVNAGTRVLLRSGTAVNLLNETNQELDLGENVDLLNYTAIEIRFLQYSTTINNESINLYSTLRAVNTGVGYGNIPAVKYNDSANGIASNICFLTLSGSKIKVVSAGSASQFFISTVIGYK